MWKKGTKVAKKTPENIWSEVLAIIKDSISQQSFQTWFGPTKVVSLDEDCLCIEVPNKFFKEWIENHYREILEASLGRVSNKILKLKITLARHNSFSSSGTVPEKPGAGGNVPSSFNPKYSFSSFVIGHSNRLAHAAALAVAESPARAYNPLFIYGGVGLGKTHLMQSIGRDCLEKKPHLNVLYISSEKFTNQLISAIQNRTTLPFREKYRSVDVLLIDDIQFLAGKESTQEEFFHTFNTLYDAHKQVVISCDRAPKEIPTLEERLVSRFEWGLVADVQSPDIETRIAILRKKTENENLIIPDEVTYFIADKIKSNIRELEGAMIRVIAYASLINREINLDLTQEVLKNTLKKDVEKDINVDLIQRKVADYFDIRLADMKSKGRNRSIVHPRQIAMYLSRNLTDLSLPEIGGCFGGRDHTTVIYACDKIQKQLKEKAGIRNIVNKLVEDIKN